MHVSQKKTVYPTEGITNKKIHLVTVLTRISEMALLLTINA